MEFFNLTCYERQDLMNCIHGKDKKKYNCYTPVRLNLIDKLVAKEHEYNYHRVCIFGLWVLMGAFVPLWFLLMWLFHLCDISNSDFILGMSFIICFILGICLDLIYNNSCDKIDYNTIIKKNQQMNLFDDFGVEYKYSK